jgi:replicative DNA helicase
MSITPDLYELAAADTQHQNTLAEASVLSILMSFPGAFDSVGDRLEAHHFVDPTNRLIFVELRNQLLAGKEPDVISLGDALKGRVTYVDIQAITASHDHTQRGLKQKVDLLIQHYKTRKLFEVSHKIDEIAADLSPIQERIDRAQAALAELDDEADTDGWVDASTMAVRHLELIERRETGNCGAMATGFADVDEFMDGGLNRGTFGVIGARPAQGKTALGLAFAEHLAQRYSVGFFSMEMPEADLADRMLAMLGRVSLGALKRPGKQSLDYGRVVDAVEKTRALKFHLCDKAGLNILNVRTRSRALKRKHGLDVVIVDYLGLMPGLDPRMPRAYQMEQITQGLKTMAKELDIAVIALAQVNRSVADRADQTPQLSDLRDSGSIEQDADWVGFIDRPIVNKPDLADEWKHYAKFRISKNRQGRIGDVHLFYQADETRFCAWSGPPPESMHRISRKAPL